MAEGGKNARSALFQQAIDSVLENTLLVSRQDVASIYRARQCLINGAAPRPGMAEGGKNARSAIFCNRLPGSAIGLPPIRLAQVVNCAKQCCSRVFVNSRRPGLPARVRKTNVFFRQLPVQ